MPGCFLLGISYDTCNLQSIVTEYEMSLRKSKLLLQSRFAGVSLVSQSESALCFKMKTISGTPMTRTIAQDKRELVKKLKICKQTHEVGRHKLCQWNSKEYRCVSTSLFLQ